MLTETKSPVEEALNGNYTCPECQAITITFRVITEDYPTRSRTLKLTCQNGHTWESSVAKV